MTDSDGYEDFDRVTNDDSDKSDDDGVEESATEPWVPVLERCDRFVGRVLQRIQDDPGAAVQAAFTVLAITISTAVVLFTVHPDLLWRNTTPTGGDMGAHVWGPQYLKTNVLPNFGLTGWTHDWYNGFPAYQFYMVIPSLLIVFLNVGMAPLVAIPLVVLLLAGAFLVWNTERLYPYRRVATVAAVALAVLVLPMTYNRSFKLVTVIGLLGLPIASWAMAKLADLPFPTPPLAAIASLLFLYNREPLYLNHGNIIGGNLTSTMAGEFAFSISLTLAVLYLGVASRGLRTGRYRALSAVLFALAGLCHLIPAFFVLACTAALFLLHPDKARLKWLSTMVPVAGLLTAFWVLPFWWRRHYVNDMGWERLPEAGAELSKDGLAMAGDQSSAWYYLFPPSGIRWVMYAAIAGVIVSIIRRYRLGMVLALAWAGVAAAFVVMPQYRLWNARLLPFMYLVVVLLAAIGVGEVIRISGIIASGKVERPYRPITIVISSVVALCALVAVIIPVNGLFEVQDTNFGFERKSVSVRSGDGRSATTETVRQASFKLFGYPLYTATPNWSPVSSWAAWNYSGLEDKPQNCTTTSGEETCTGGWPEYRDFIATMDRLGKDPQYGCGRMMWEFNADRINTYGTTMTPMLLPYWTDGCIASQEGLYFESTPSVPFHFMMQSELSTSPSRPQRFLNWPDFDIEQGVEHLQLMGVRYYGAITSEAIAAADAHPDLTPIAQTPAWHIYEVADAPEVAALEFEPVVVEGIGESQDEWLPTAGAWFQKGDLSVPMALDGPSEWKRVRAEPVPTHMRRLTDWLMDQIGEYEFLDGVPDQPRKKLPKNEVTNIRHTETSVSFDVSTPGVPVLVKTSYFPNWRVSGGKGPYRVAPNLMVVVPTSEHVSLDYERTPPDILAYVLTLLGIIGLFWLTRQKPVEVSELNNGPLSDWLDDALSVKPRPAHEGWAQAGDDDGVPRAQWTEAPVEPIAEHAGAPDPDEGDVDDGVSGADHELDGPFGEDAPATDSADASADLPEEADTDGQDHDHHDDLWVDTDSVWIETTTDADDDPAGPAR